MFCSIYSNQGKIVVNHCSGVSHSHDSFIIIIIIQSVDTLFFFGIGIQGTGWGFCGSAQLGFSVRRGWIQKKFLLCGDCGGTKPKPEAPTTTPLDSTGALAGEAGKTTGPNRAENWANQHRAMNISPSETDMHCRLKCFVLFCFPPPSPQIVGLLFKATQLRMMSI